MKSMRAGRAAYEQIATQKKNITNTNAQYTHHNPSSNNEDKRTEQYHEDIDAYDYKNHFIHDDDGGLRHGHGDDDDGHDDDDDDDVYDDHDDAGAAATATTAAVAAIAI